MQKRPSSNWWISTRSTARVRARRRKQRVKRHAARGGPRKRPPAPRPEIPSPVQKKHLRKKSKKKRKQPNRNVDLIDIKAGLSSRFCLFSCAPVTATRFLAPIAFNFFTLQNFLR